MFNTSTPKYKSNIKLRFVQQLHNLKTQRPIYLVDYSSVRTFFFKCLSFYKIGVTLTSLQAEINGKS